MNAIFSSETPNRTKSSFLSSPLILCLLAIILFMLSACSGTSGTWQHPSKPKDQWSKDVSVCKGQANALINRQIDIENDSTFVERNQLQVQFATQDARNKRFTYFTNCMNSKGYSQVSER